MNLRHPTVICLLLLLVTAPLGAQENSPGADEVFDRASEAFQRGNYQDSLNLYKQFAENNPNDSRFWDARFGLAQSQYKLNQFREANRQFAAVRKNHPDKTVRGDALFGQIQVAILQDHVALARSLSETFLNIHDDHILRSSVERQLELLGDEEVEPEGTDTNPVSVAESSEDQPEESPPSDQSTGRDGAERSEGASEEERRDSNDEAGLPGLRFGGQDTSTDSTDSTDRPRSDEGHSEVETATETGRAETTPDSTVRELRTRLGKSSDTVERQQKTISELRSQLEQMRERSDTLERENERLRRQLSREISRLADDTALHNLSRTTDLSDTAEQTLQSSLDELREQSRSALDSGRPGVAWQRIQEVLSRSPTATDHRLAATIASERGDTQTVLEHLNQAIESSDTPNVEVLSRKAEVLLADNHIDEFDELVEQYNSVVSQSPDSPEVARWYLALGRRDLLDDRMDPAFFHLMQAVRAAPQSPPGREAQTLIQSEL